ncbi:hypothetical protein [Allosphingosinicella vermicomposti]|uniref:hypothetical protein n=1 Tax=Allosphingosinicella vermicomposti TaxID=614671 RepID=UPI00131A4B54|nr:hypothetical protein [Allosphingosinicella vermicomposti]
MTEPAFEPAIAPAPVQRRRGRTALWLLPLFAFLVGLAAMAWILTQWQDGARYLGIGPRDAAPPPAAAPQAATPPASVAIVDPEVSRRVSILEQRLSEIANQSQAAVGNADRAEGLLVAFAARRALDRGVALGYIEGLLRQRFAATQPQAVGTIISAAREPITLQELQEGLQAVSPTLAGAGTERDWWTAFKVELGSLITVRKEGTPSTVPAERVARATDRLAAGQVDVALAEILRIPGHGAATDWIADARRYVAARRALDTIETAALLEPRTGQAQAPLPVEEAPSPARPAA